MHASAPAFIRRISLTMGRGFGPDTCCACASPCSARPDQGTAHRRARSEALDGEIALGEEHDKPIDEFDPGLPEMVPPCPVSKGVAHRLSSVCSRPVGPSRDASPDAWATSMPRVSRGYGYSHHVPHAHIASVIGFLQ